MYTVRKPVKRLSLRLAYAGTTVATLFLVVSGEPALAHVNVQPSLVEGGVITDVRVELPPLQGGRPPSGLEVEGPGIQVLAIRQQANAGPESVWTVRLRADGQAGNTPIVLRTLYPGGSAVEVDAALTVVPGPEGSSFPWPGVIVGAALAGGFAVVALLVARRKA
jgi:hypothetical protein